MKYVHKGVSLILAALCCAAAVADTLAASDCKAEGVQFARTAFNNAIKEDDMEVMAKLFDESVVLVTGTDSDVFIGKEKQLELWRSEMGDSDRLAYVRATTSVRVSPLYPIAMESGLWTGKAKTGDEVGGEYSAKWRCEGQQWVLEAELFVTTRCAGALCDL